MFAGKYYTVAVKMDGDQVKFVQEMRERMLDEYGTVPDYVFSNSQNGQETKIAWYINQCFTELFGDDPTVTRYNATSIRKFWDEHIDKMNLQDNDEEAHFSQTGHSRSTAKKHYISKQTLQIILYQTTNTFEIFYATFSIDVYISL